MWTAFPPSSPIQSFRLSRLHIASPEHPVHTASSQFPTHSALLRTPPPPLPPQSYRVETEVETATSHQLWPLSARDAATRETGTLTHPHEHRFVHYSNTAREQSRGGIAAPPAGPPELAGDSKCLLGQGSRGKGEGTSLPRPPSRSPPQRPSPRGKP